LKWSGKRGRLEIVYDEVDEVWRGFMAVKVEKPPIRGGKPLYIDLGARCLSTVWAEGWKQPIAFSGNQPLSDWWYWNGKIAEEQSRLAKVNRAKTSRRLRRLYRIRQRRFRHAVNTTTRKRLFKCHNCGLEAHRDAVGVLNMGALRRGMPIGVVAHPLLLRWNEVGA